MTPQVMESSWRGTLPDNALQTLGESGAVAQAVVTDAPRWWDYCANASHRCCLHLLPS
jgi:hypothetical protein